MTNLGALKKYLLRYPRKLGLGIAANFGMAMVGLGQPVVVGRAVDALHVAVSGRTLLLYAGVLVGIAALQGALSFVQRMTLVALSRDVEFDLRQEYFAQLLRLPLTFYQRSHTGDLMARATNDLQAVRMVCGPAIMYSGSTLFTAAGALALMVHLDLRLTLLALATLPLVALARSPSDGVSTASSSGCRSSSRRCRPGCRRISPARGSCEPMRGKRTRSPSSSASMPSTWPAAIASSNRTRRSARSCNC